MEEKTSYTVFPFNIYGAQTVFPRPYYSYEPRPPGEFLVKPEGRNPDAYKTQVFGWGEFANGYGEGNLIGHTCENECKSMPAMPYYGNLTTPQQTCWCYGKNKCRCAMAKGTVSPPWKGRTRALPRAYNCS